MPAGIAVWALALGALAAGALAGTAGASSRPLVAAHRGGALLWPENSLQAFRGALALGVDLLEADVHLTADDEVVVLHDATLDRTTTGRGPVRDLRLADLDAVRLRGDDGRPTREPVPTLRQLLELLRPARAGLLLEIKAGPGGRPYPGIEEKVLDLLRGAGLASRTVVMAFRPEILRRVRALAPDARTAFLVERRTVERRGAAPAETVAWARALGTTHLGVEFDLLDAAVVEAARAAGITLAVWTPNDEADLRRVIGLGADIVISDRPDRALSLAGR
jgi:glycerophosphoryl diester phosphodiesterase